MMQFERQPARQWRIMCYLQRLHSTIVQHTVWQLVFECIANWMAVVIAPYIVFVLMLDLLHFVFRSRVACLWIGPRLALAARCG